MTLKHLLCKILGHKISKAVYALDLRQTWGAIEGCKTPTKKALYAVVEEHTCDRCGEVFMTILSKPLHRSQLLKQGWFMERHQNNGGFKLETSENDR